jgi:hypothetical protein
LDTVEGAFERICSILSHCIKNGLVFNAEKFKFARMEVEFAGLMITEDGIKPAAKYTASIKDFTTTSNISEVRVWFGLENQVAYCFCKTEIMSPFRHLLTPNTPFEWKDDLEAAISASKETILEMIKKVVYSFDSELETCLRPDYSKEGMGWILQHKSCTCKKIYPTCCPDGWRLVLAGGAFCIPAERNYSPIEGEASAIFKGLQDTVLHPRLQETPHCH